MFCEVKNRDAGAFENEQLDGRRRADGVSPSATSACTRADNFRDYNVSLPGMSLGNLTPAEYPTR